jgi:GT2 family glycosyltransferase
LKKITKNQIDIIILSWNRVEETIETIDNVLSQKEVETKIWIVDQGSSKETINALKNHITNNSSMQLIELKQNYGVAGGRNRGMKLGAGEFIVCIDNDAIFESEYAIKKTIDYFNSNEKIAIIGYKIKNFYTNIVDRPNWVYARQLMAKQDEEFLTTRFCGAGHAIRRSVLEETDWYDEKLFFYWEELDLSYQIINRGYDVIYLPDVVVLHKVSSDQRVKWQGNRYYFLVRNAIYLDWKYFSNIARLMLLGFGYLIKAVINGVFFQFLRAVFDALKMINKLDASKYKLDRKAKEYIITHDVSYRGTLVTRFFREVLEKLG